MPPPPPPPGPPPPPSMPKGGIGNQPKIGGAVPTGNARAALLQSIQQGKALKKTVTNDRSGPLVGGKSSSNNRPSNNLSSSGSSRGNLGQASSNSTPRLPGIGGLFADGIPTLRKTQGGIDTGRKESTSNSNLTANNYNAPKTPQNNYQSGNGNAIGGGMDYSGDQRNYFNRSTSHSSINGNNSMFTSSSLLYSTSTSMSEEKYNFFMRNSTPSLTPPSASPAPSSTSSHTTTNRRNAPPPPAGARKPVHPNSKPPPPPAPGLGGQQAPPPKPPHANNTLTGNKPAMRAKSFNQGGPHVTEISVQHHRSSRDDSHLNASLHSAAPPPPPIRTVSQSQSMRRPTGAAPMPPGGKRTPMKPPSAPPPPPPTVNPPPPEHRKHPPPDPMASLTMDAPPTPPTRYQSMRSNGNLSSGYNSSSSNSGGESFESRFQHLFKTPQFLPPPEPFTGCLKTYPSRSQQFAGRQGSMAKRTPAPPPPIQTQTMKLENRSHGWAYGAASQC